MCARCVESCRAVVGSEVSFAPTVFGRDLRVRSEYDTGTHTVSEGELVNFARQWDPLAIHVDVSCSAVGRFGGVIASGIHTLAVFQRLAVRRHFSSWSIVAGRGIRDIRFVRPVRPGDALTGSFVVSELCALSERTDRVVIAGRLIDRREAAVLTLSLDLQVDHEPP